MPPRDRPNTANTTDIPDAGAYRCEPGDYDQRFDDLATVAYRVAYRIVGQREEARDLAQEAMARAYARWPHVRDNAQGWVSRVATNLALDVVRKRARRPARDAGAPVDVAYRAAERADLVDALLALPRRQRDVVVLRYLADLSERDVAETLGCKVGTVKRHAHRGLAALRLRLALEPVLPTPAASTTDVSGASEPGLEGLP
jgi:RNA polymerase sigma factor (sigma-70 family)